MLKVLFSAQYILQAAFLSRFIDDEDEDLVESFKDNEFVLTEQVVKNGYELVTSILVLAIE